MIEAKTKRHAGNPVFCPTCGTKVMDGYLLYQVSIYGKTRLFCDDCYAGLERMLEGAMSLKASLHLRNRDGKIRNAQKWMSELK